MWNSQDFILVWKCWYHGKVITCIRQSVSIHLRRGSKQVCPKVLVISWIYFVKNIYVKCEGQRGLNFFGKIFVNTLIFIYNNDYMIKWTYFCNETSSKSTVTNSLQKCDHCTQIWDISGDPLYSKLNYSNHSHTHNSNHLEPLGKNRKPPARFARFGG